jgi:hypothetical protein
MIVFFNDFLTGFAFVMLALQFAFRLELFFYFLCVYFQSFYQLRGLGWVRLDYIRRKRERRVLLFVLRSWIIHHE